MSYQVIARKYRPQTLDEVVGQDVVTRTLRNAIESGRIAHAFLFSGVRGVGKTTTARILAKALNCQKGLSAEPCGECDSCREIAISASVDVQEIDAASNTGVDNIRELREGTRYGTARDRFKIYVIDEVHMLSNAAFNALLKTLEEPPDHVKFILATTEHRKIPVTITSRCQQFDFKTIPFPAILDRLVEVCRSEGIQISDTSLRSIARAGQGSMRDAQSALDQILSFGGSKISDEEVRALLGLVDDELIMGIVDAVVQRDRQALIEKTRSLVEFGVDPRSFCRELTHHLRNLMVCQVTGWNNELLHLPDSYKERFLKQAESVSELELIRFYDLLNRTEEELKWNLQPYVHLEIALIKLVALSGLSSIEDLIGELQEDGGPKGSGPSKAPKPKPERRETRLASVPRPDSHKPEGPPDPAPITSAGGAAAAAAPKVLPEPAPVADEKPVEAPHDFVPALLEAVHRESLGLYQWLRQPTRIAFEDGKLLVEVSAEDSIRRSMLDNSESRDLLSRLSEGLGVTLSRIAVSSPKTTPVSRPKDEDPAQDPQVQAFLEKFPGKYVINRNLEE